MLLPLLPLIRPEGIPRFINILYIEFYPNPRLLILDLHSATLIISAYYQGPS